MNVPVGVKYSRPLISIQDIVNFIDKGEKYIKNNLDDMTEADQMDVLHGIILSPDYQREYRSKPSEEAAIIESIILGIPIPEIFLVRTSNHGIQLRHVMDGQHRLTAIYRYVKDKYPLKSLEILKENEDFYNKRFSELSRDHKIQILGSHLSILEFYPFDDDEIEIELFKRYNRNTKPLEPHEISMATFYSKTSQYITNFLNEHMENQNKSDFSDKIVKIYNITQNRKNKQKNHQEICIIMNILLYGPNSDYKDGVDIANSFLEIRSKMFKEDKENDLNELVDVFHRFNKFLFRLDEEIDYPFSTNIIFADDKRSVKYHTGVSIILAMIFYYYDINLESSHLVLDIRKIFELSPLGDATYRASSTNIRNIDRYLFEENHIDKITFTALNYKKK